MIDKIDRKIISVAGWLKVALRIAKEAENNGNYERYYYRGERTHYSQLIPRLQQKRTDLASVHSCHGDNILDLQRWLLYRLARYTSEHHYDHTISNFFEWLCVGQHHGLPTLLLDWSLNPLVALFHAVDDPHNKYKGKDARLWIMTLKPKEDRRKQTIYVGSETVDAGLDGVQKDLKPVVGQPLIVVPRILTRRIDAQAGRFIYWPKLTAVDDPASYDLFDDTPWQKLQMYTVAEGHKDTIKKHLRALRIHEGTMYADLDGYARYLAGGGL
jgi:hypothetical protein